jgi:hypothetical protein
MQADILLALKLVLPFCKQIMGAILYAIFELLGFK